MVKLLTDSSQNVAKGYQGQFPLKVMSQEVLSHFDNSNDHLKRKQNVLHHHT